MSPDNVMINPFLTRPPRLAEPRGRLRYENPVTDDTSTSYNREVSTRYTAAAQSSNTNIPEKPLQQPSPELYASYYLPSKKTAGSVATNTGPFDLFKDVYDGYKKYQETKKEVEKKFQEVKDEAKNVGGTLQKPAQDFKNTMQNTLGTTKQLLASNATGPQLQDVTAAKADTVSKAINNVSKDGSEALANLVNDIRQTPYVGTAVAQGLVQGGLDSIAPITSTIGSFASGEWGMGTLKLLGWGVAIGVGAVAAKLIPDTIKKSVILGVAGLGTAYAGTKAVKSGIKIRQALRNHAPQEVQDTIADTTKWSIWTAAGGAFTKRSFRKLIG